ncbi:MAG: SpoIIE family protein phosphatase [Candidatus Riflebacteria bacterium]|nr:SpoIIE family protein phosphatase [Candidatus Riflebacteria bacterium]
MTSHWRWLLTVTIFLALPFLVFFVAISRIWDGMEEEDGIRHRKVLTTRSVLLAARLEVPNWFRHRLRRAGRVLAQPHRSGAAIQEGLARLFPPSLGPHLSVWAFDTSGTVVFSTRPDRAPGPETDLFQFLSGYLQTGPAVLLGETGRWERVARFLGVPPDGRPFLRQPAVNSPSGMWFDWPGSSGMLVARGGGVILTGVIHPQRGARAIVDGWGLHSFKQRNRNRLLSAGVIPSFPSGDLTGLPASVRAACLDFLLTGARTFASADDLVALFSRDDGSLLWVQRPMPRGRFGRFRELLFGSGLLLVFSLSLQIWRVLNGLDPFWASLQHQLPVLFLFVTAIPVTLTVLFGGEWIFRKASQAAVTLDHQVRSHLVAIDREIAGYGIRLPAGPGATTVGGRPSSGEIQVLASIRQHLGATTVMWQSGSTTTALGALPETFLRRGIHHGEPGPGPGPDSGAEALRHVCRARQLRTGLLTGHWVAGPCAMRETSVSRRHPWRQGGTSDVVSVGPHPVFPEGVWTFHWEPEAWARRHLARQIARLWRSIPRLSLVAYHRDSGGLLDFRQPAARSIPETLLRRLGESLLETGVGEARELRIGSRRWLLIGEPGRRHDKMAFIAILPRDVPREMVHGQLLSFRAVHALPLLLAILLGLLTGRRFLSPVRSLLTGLEAIRQRVFTFRLQAGHGEEFDTLAATFNSVMESLADLESGRIVQTSLLPARNLRAGPFSAFGQTRFATELTGDVLAVGQTPSGSLSLFIGDMAGHGVGAALGMAMAKGIICREMAAGTAPDGIMAVLHAVLGQFLRGRRMLTCCLVTVDPDQNRVAVLNAGHPSPVLYLPGEAPAPMPMPSLPLGEVRRLRLAEREFPMPAGSRLLLYTNGMFEIQCGGKPLGLPALVQLGASCSPTDPVAACSDLLTAVLTQPGIENQTDDMTVLFLLRGDDR